MLNITFTLHKNIKPCKYEALIRTPEGVLTSPPPLSSRLGLWGRPRDVSVCGIRISFIGQKRCEVHITDIHKLGKL